MFTSSSRTFARYSASSSGIDTRGICVRSFAFIVARSSLRHSASRSVRQAASSVEGQALGLQQLSASAFGAASATGPRCASKFAISSCSTFLNVPIRLNISSQSTCAPSNSGPSIQTNFVLPPIVSRQAPHIPVPSTMIVFNDTSQGMLCFCAVRFENFIMMGGPMANTLSTCGSCSMNFSIPTVTTPFSPYEPSSVMMMTSSDVSRTLSSRIIRSFERPASTDNTRFPAFFRAWMMGSIGATPTPPPAQTTVP